MTPETAIRVFVAANLMITAGYLYAAAFVAPKFDVERWYVAVAAIWFFVTCGLTHVEQVVHTITGDLDPAVATSGHMLVIHVTQAFAIWVFVVGLRRQLERGGVRGG